MFFTPPHRRSSERLHSSCLSHQPFPLPHLLPTGFLIFTHVTWSLLRPLLSCFSVLSNIPPSVLSKCHPLKKDLLRALLMDTVNCHRGQDTRKTFGQQACLSISPLISPALTKSGMKGCVVWKEWGEKQGQVHGLASRASWAKHSV